MALPYLQSYYRYYIWVIYLSIKNDAPELPTLISEQVLIYALMIK